jgi:hypothetical protein
MIRLDRSRTWERVSLSDFRGDRIGQLAVPGLDLHFYRIASDGYPIWSLKLSLLIPVILMFLIALLFRRSLTRVRAHVERVIGEL